MRTWLQQLFPRLNLETSKLDTNAPESICLLDLEVGGMNVACLRINSLLVPTVVSVFVVEPEIVNLLLSNCICDDVQYSVSGAGRVKLHILQ